MTVHYEELIVGTYFVMCEQARFVSMGLSLNMCYTGSGLCNSLCELYIRHACIES